ncbi:MAG: hypothetical protein EZS26_000778 [Candidatus Ordinivivax streblomastigis]|uniref:Endonuclease GajA/Old nuclease/RecF-like AAA domain-containing protein n=1 Tax=Candidatus Ordinivivax streblomastigis TaxID=2540710 RepID=A0A5M8P3W2_9BACT|nr:MAG: hypothetical protein EZS26_000778 [Candidatus Ordinivivax streblomastigis]
MKRVTAKEMTLVNFKGIKSLTIKFGMAETEIRGANATGKSTIADAFNWVLFGKDKDGNSDSKFGIKTNDPDGNVIPKIDHEVTAVLDINGETVELRRCYSEDWVTPRGSAESVLKGHATSYFYNGVPLKESEYKAKINDIINEDLFRMITNPLYFPRLDWQVQRDMLLRIAGGITLEEIAKDRSEFAELLTQLSGKSLVEYKAEISARKKKLKEALDLIPARIDEVTRATPKDYVQNEKMLLEEKNRLQGYLEEIDKAIGDKAEAQRQQYTAAQGTQKQINDLKSTQQRILFDAQTKAQNTANESNLKRNELSNEYQTLTRERDGYLSKYNRDIDEHNGDKTSGKEEIKHIEFQIEQLRKNWFIENEKEYTESDICPVCGQLLPEEKRADKRRIFDENKADKLEEITKTGVNYSQKVDTIKKDIASIDKYLSEESKKCEGKQTEYETRLKAISDQLKAIPEITPSRISGEDIPEWVETENKIKELSQTLQTQPAAVDNSELTTKKQELTTALDDIKQKISLRSIIEQNNKRKEELLKEEKDLAQQKADLEKREFIADSLVKEQMNEVERRVNYKFSLVRFKMFSQQINGGEKPDCILLGPEGAKFMDTNSAGKIAMGLDIINTLCEFNGVYAPIFVDNAEGINKIIPVTSQLIKLVVTTDKKLTFSQI